jgi:hypothetical protein
LIHSIARHPQPIKTMTHKFKFRAFRQFHQCPKNNSNLDCHHSGHQPELAQTNTRADNNISSDGDSSRATYSCKDCKTNRDSRANNSSNDCDSNGDSETNSRADHIRPDNIRPDNIRPDRDSRTVSLGPAVPSNPAAMASIFASKCHGTTTRKQK